MHEIKKKRLLKYEKKALFDQHTRKNRVQKQKSRKFQIYILKKKKISHFDHS